ncbi:MAG: O-antigen ligase family protein [Candidatus Liptonbacteria bacterium]|nr:O-antigen ligase family protein [Candidatus Liptonbacteria bacterium]
MSEKNLLKTIIGLIFIIVIGTPLFYFNPSVYPYTLTKTLFFQIFVEIAFFLWLALAISFPRYRPKFTPLISAGAVFFGIYLLTSFAGIDLWRSLWSTYERGIGFFAMLHFAVFGLIVSSLFNELPWRKIFYSSLAVSIFIGFIAYAQLYVPNLLLIENPGDRPGATFGNPTFMAGYLVLHVFLAIYLFLRQLQENKNARIKLFFTGAAGTLNALVAVFFAQTRGDILGLAAGIMTLLFIFSIKPLEEIRGFLGNRKVYIVLMIAIVLSAALFFVTKENPFWSKIPGISRFSSLSLSGDSSLTPRLSALKAGWEGFLEKPILGWGPGNFIVIYDRHYDPKALASSYRETNFDKPHNLFLEYANAGGIILFIAFIGFFAAAVYESFRQGDRIWRSVFMAMLASYAVSQLFFFETIGPLLMMFLFLGATNGAFREKSGDIAAIRNISQKNAVPTKISPAVAGVCLVAAFVPVYFVNINSLKASNHLYNGFQNFLHQDIFRGLGDFEKAAATWSPYSWNFKRDYAIAVASQYFNYPGTVSDEDALKAIKAMEEVRNEHPADAFNHYALVNLYNEVASIDPETYTKKAEDEAKVALEISPKRQETYFYLAKTKTIEGDYTGALSILKQVLDDNPGVPDAHFYYGLLAFATGDPATGYAEIKTAIKMGREWKNFYEPRTIAGYFADSGHLSEAIELYKTAWNMSEHSDLETEIKLGVAYFYARQFDDAREYLVEAVKKLNIKDSPSYAQLEPILRQLGIGF